VSRNEVGIHEILSSALKTDAMGGSALATIV